MKKMICLFVFCISFIFFSEMIYAQEHTGNIKGEIIKDKQNNVIIYKNDYFKCSFAVPYSWILADHQPLPQGDSILFAKYTIAGSVLHGGENSFVSLHISEGFQVKLEEFVNKVYIPEYEREFGIYSVKLLGKDTIVIKGNRFIRVAFIAGKGAKSERHVVYFFVRDNNLYHLSLNISPGSKEDVFNLPTELENILGSLDIK